MSEMTDIQKQVDALMKGVVVCRMLGIWQRSTNQREGIKVSIEDQIERDPLWTAEDIAKILKVSIRQVSERYAMMPGFPAAIRLPSPKGRGINRWKSSDIIAWIESLKKAA